MAWTRRKPSSRGLPTGFYGDRLLGLAKDYSISAFYINTALFDAAGLPTLKPDGPGTTCWMSPWN
jgi:ABC-type glycerol-3-phosphate transport system substrate-binding protein